MKIPRGKTKKRKIKIKRKIIKKINNNNYKKK